MSSFSSHGRKEIAYQFDPDQRWSPELYADPTLGSTIAPRKVGFWGITMQDKQVNAQIQESGNFATWIANTVVSPFQFGQGQTGAHFVSTGASMRMHEAAGEPLDGWDWISHKLSPIQNVQGIRRRLEFPDSEWDGTKETLKWLEQEDNQIARALILRDTGTEVFPLLKATRNREHFEYTIRIKLKEAEALSNMRAFAEQSGTTLKISSMLLSGAGNYLLTDPTFLPSMFVPFGGYQSAATRAGIVTGMRVKRIGTIASKAGSSLVLNVPAKAPTIAKGSNLTRSLAKGIVKLGDSPAALHRGMATMISHRGAVAVEMASLGGLGAHAFQRERIENSEILTDLEDYQDHYRWDEVGLGVAIGAAAGFIFGSAASHRTGRLLEASTDIAGGGASSPIRYSLDNVAGQGALDYAAVRAKRAAQSLMGNEYDSVAGYVLDDALLLEAGLNRTHMARVLEGIAEAADGELPPAAVHRILADELSSGFKARQGRTLTGDVLGSQVEQEAYANALGRAGRESPKASEEALHKLARSYMPDELAYVVQKHADRTARALSRLRARGPGGRLISKAKASQAFWRREAEDLIETGRRRDLLRHEMEYLARVDANLMAAGDASLMGDILRTRVTRYTDGTVEKALGATSGSRVGRTLRKIQHETKLIDELAKKGVTGKAPDRVNAMRRLRTARKRLIKQAGEQEVVISPQERQRNIRAALERAGQKNPKSPAEVRAAMDDLFTSLDVNASTLFEDTHDMNKFLKAVGLGGVVRRLARAGTGMEQSFRSSVAALRFISQEIDHAKMAVGHLDPTAAGTHRSMQHLLEKTHSNISEFVDLMRKFDNAGEFGNYVKNPRDYNRRLLKFNKETVRHITGNKTSTNPRVLEAAALWKKYADEIKKIGLDAGVFSEKAALDRFFPRRWNTVAIGKNRSGFRQGLSSMFHRHWEKSDEVHLGTLEAMGLAVREVDRHGEYAGHLITPEGAIPKSVKTLQRSDLAALGTDEAAYLKALRTKGADGFDPMETSANRAMVSLNGDDLYESDKVTGKLRRKRNSRSPRSEQSRVLEESVWGDEALEEFLDWRFLENAASYLRSTGMRVRNVARHQKRIGIRGVTMEDTLDYVENTILARLKGLDSTTPEEIRSFSIGIKNLREKVHLAEGRLPSMAEDVEGFRAGVSDFWVASAGAMYGQGIGSTIVSTEVAQSIVGRSYGMTDLIRRIGDAVKVSAHLVGDTTGVKALQNPKLRQQMVTMGMTQRQFRVHAMDRLLGESTYNHGFQFGTMHKLLAPWADVWKTVAGTNTNLGVANRLGQAPIGIARAVGSNMMQIGGLDFFSTWARLMHVQSSMDEMGRFFRAGERFADVLADPATTKALNKIEEEAVDAALLAKMSLEKATKAGQIARRKAWQGLARKSGFSGNVLVGSAHQVAEKWALNGMLTPGAMRAIRESGAVLDSGPFKTVDFNALQNHVAASAAADADFSSTFDSARGMLQETIRKRVSEQSLAQTPTSDFARTPMGKAANSMTTWTRSFHDNNIMDAASMPVRVGGAMLTAYLFGETVNMLMREMWNGKDIEDVHADFMDNPANYIARALTGLPWLGQFGGLTRPAADALTREGRMSKVDLGESAGEGAATAMADVIFDTVHTLTSDEDFSHRTWRTASRFMPGYRTWWGMLANGGIEAATGEDLINNTFGRGDQRRTEPASGTSVPDNAPVILTTTKPDIPEEIGFLYAQE